MAVEVTEHKGPDPEGCLCVVQKASSMVHLGMLLWRRVEPSTVQIFSAQTAAVAVWHKREV